MQRRSTSSLNTSLRSADPVSFCRPAPVALGLPSISSQPVLFTTRRKAEGLKPFAESLAKIGVLQPHHWDGDLAQACTKAMTEFTDRLHPHQLVPLSLSFSDDANLGDPDGYLWDNSIREKADGGVQVTHAHEPIGAFVVVMDEVMNNGPACETIGEELEEMESAMPQLGQTVYDALYKGLSVSCRALTPRDGLCWASNCYWGGELDETMRLEEEFDATLHHWETMPEEERKQKPKPTPADVEMFRRNDYVTQFPDWAIGKPQPLTINSLRRRRIPTKWRHTVDATIALLQWLNLKRDVTNDQGGFLTTSLDMCPYLIRWRDGDCLAQIWDDVMNDYSQNGESDMSINSVFGFHDEATLRRAVRRLGNYLEALTLTENLLQILFGKKHVRVRC